MPEGLSDNLLIPRPSVERAAMLRSGSRSLRWRLQIWHAWVLLTVLAIFGTIVYHLLWQSRLHQIDAELDRTNEVMMSQLGRLLPWPTNFAFRGPGRRGGRNNDRDRSGDRARANRGAPEKDSPAAGPPTAELPATDRPATEQNPIPPPSRQERRREERRREDRPFPQVQPPGPPDRSLADLKLPESFRQLFEGDEETRLYFVIWGPNGVVLQKSDSAPHVPYPDLRVAEDGLPVRAVRLREDKREVMHGFKYGLNVLVGRPITQDLAEQHATGALLAAAGLGVLGIGLVGGWWLAARAIRPIAAMTATAAAISADNLSERIDVLQTDDELGQLASVLNRTLDRLQTAFEQQQQFTADASHELRTPLAVILGQAELALSRPRESNAYQEALATCQRAAQRMRSLLDGLLTLARFDSGQGVQRAGEVDLEQTAWDCVELVQPLADERQITIHVQTTPVTITADRERIAQVLTNLLMNAIRYNHDGGTVELRVAQVQDQAKISVADSGQGIPPDDLPHIFDRFYRADEARSDGGSGLGLSICKSIVEAHGGLITARSQPGQGTTVEVLFPGAVRPVRAISEAIAAPL